MPRSKKKKSQTASGRVAPKRNKPSLGLWIAPDLERRTKGEEGRRGLSEPPYAYYLQLADLVLGGSKGPEAHTAHRPSHPVQVEPIFAPAPVEELPPLVTPAIQVKPSRLELPRPSPPKPPKLTVPSRSKLPRPPKAPSSPKRPKLNPPKPPKRRHL